MAHPRAAAPADPLTAEAFFTTNLILLPARVIDWFVWRWSIEVTFAKVRRHLGVETQRQWAAKDKYTDPF